MLKVDDNKLREMSKDVEDMMKRLELEGNDADEFKQLIQKAIQRHIAKATERSRSDARGILKQNRGASERGVSYGVWKTKLGASVGILDTSRGRKETAKRPYTPGKQRTVSARTIAINEYYGRDRAFILRMLNSGTDVRIAKSMTRGRGSKATWGKRGAIGAKNWFAGTAGYMSQAASDIAEEIQQIIDKYTQ